MHPLRHPRNAAMVGIIFVIIGIVYYAVPAAEGLEHQLRHRGRDDAAGLPRGGDGDHGLRARGRIHGRVTGRLRGDATRA